MIESKSNTTEYFQSLSTLHEYAAEQQAKPTHYEQDYFFRANHLG